MAIYQLEDRIPQLHSSAWVAESASVIGSVVLEAGANVWYGSVLRGDNDRMHIGVNANVQDGCVLHTDNGYPLVLEEGVTVGHQVMLHGCHIGQRSLIAIQSVVLNGVRIGRDCIVGAGSLIPEGKEFPDGVMIMGSPAKVVRELRPEQLEMLKRLSEHYVMQTARHRAGLKRLA